MLDCCVVVFAKILVSSFLLFLFSSFSFFLDRWLVPHEPEAGHRLSTGLCTHWAPHLSQRPTTLCPPVVLERRLVPYEPEASHRLSTGLCTHGSPHMSQRPTTLCPSSGLGWTAHPTLAGGKPLSVHRALYTWVTSYESKTIHPLPMQWSWTDGSSHMSRRQATVCSPGSVHMGHLI